MSILAGIEAKVASHTLCLQKTMLPAEMNCLETLKEFATHMGRHFVLKPPSKQKEGKNIAKDLNIAQCTLEKLIIKLLACKKSAVIHLENNVPKMEQATDLPSLDHNAKSQDLPSLLDLASLAVNGFDVVEEICNQYSSDFFFGQIFKEPKEFQNFEVKDGLIFLKEKDKLLLCIPRIITKGRSIKEIIISKAQFVLAHLGAATTIDYLRSHVW
uniref:Integrase zinc-binding domain-containing protein n=1 Tax=Psilocybe cubensis TaxID=181762 RepID=A0A8H8CIE0_PSICU